MILAKKYSLELHQNHGKVNTTAILLNPQSIQTCTHT